jgi:hypothetical protein
MDLRHFDKPKASPVLAPSVNHVTWVKELVRKHSVNEAYRIVRPLAVPLFIYKKESTLNQQFGFYKSALDYLKKHFPYQGKKGGIHA